MSTTPIDEDLEAVLVVNDLRAWMRSGMDLSQAIAERVSEARSADVPMDPAAVRASYDRGIVVLRQFRPVWSERTRFGNDDHTREQLRRQGVTGPIRCLPAGHIATTQQYQYVGLAPKEHDHGD